jgi:hypothetical protein
MDWMEYLTESVTVMAGGFHLHMDIFAAKPILLRVRIRAFQRTDYSEYSLLETDI